MKIKVSLPAGSLYNSHTLRADFRTVDLPGLLVLGKLAKTEASNPLDPHIHPGCYEVCFHCRGRQSYFVGEQEFITHGGDFFLTGPGEIHSTGPHPEEKSDFFYLIFQAPQPGHSFMNLSPEDSRWILSTLNNCPGRVFRGVPEVQTLLDQVLELYFSQAPMRVSRMHSLMVRFFYLLCTCAGQQAASGSMPEDIASIVAWIQEHPQEHFTVEDLAGRVFLSESQFKQKFKACTGFSPHDYIMRQKIERSKQMLLSGLRITEITNLLNFSSSQHFATAFRRYTGKSPSQYRKDS